MSTATITPLVPEAEAAPDLIAAAIERLKQDPGAVFEAGVLGMMRSVRDIDPARWAR
jgi:hypothetical protein